MSDLSGIVRLRDQREALTLRTILGAARRLFAQRGYARTPIRVIASEAGVVTQTVYAHFGSKAGVLTGLVDLLDDEAGLPDLMTWADQLTDPVELLGLLATAARQVREHCGDIVAVLDSGAAVDAEIAKTQAEARRRNRLGVDTVIVRIRELGHFIDARATEVAVALMSGDVHRSLVSRAGWSHDEYEMWLRQTLDATLLSAANRA